MNDYDCQGAHEFFFVLFKLLLIFSIFGVYCSIIMVSVFPDQWALIPISILTVFTSYLGGFIS